MIAEFPGKARLGRRIAHTKVQPESDDVSIVHSEGPEVYINDAVQVVDDMPVAVEVIDLVNVPRNDSHVMHVVDDGDENKKVEPLTCGSQTDSADQLYQNQLMDLKV